MTAARIVNLTPHEIVMDLRPGRWTLPPSGIIARAIERVIDAAPIEGVPTTLVEYDGIEGIPKPEDGRWYVVSLIAAEAAKQWGRTTEDLLTPGQQIRDASGRVIGCASLQRVR